MFSPETWASLIPAWASFAVCQGHRRHRPLPEHTSQSASHRWEEGWVVSVWLERPDPPPTRGKQDVHGGDTQEVRHVDKCFWMTTLFPPPAMLTTTQQSLSTTWLECLRDDVSSCPGWLKMKKEAATDKSQEPARSEMPGASEWGRGPRPEFDSATAATGNKHGSLAPSGPGGGSAGRTQAAVSTTICKTL